MRSIAYGITASGAILLLNTVIAAALALYTWKRRAMNGGIYLFILLVSIAVWSFTGAFEDMAYDYYGKILWSKLAYLGIVAVAPSWLLFALYYRYEKKVNRWSALVWILPVCMLAAVFTNEAHHLVWPSVVWAPAETGHRVVYAHGPLKWGMALYSYALLLAGTVLLLRTVLSSHKLFKGQFLVVSAAAIAPWVGNITYLTGITPSWIDTTPLCFMITGVLLSWAFTRFHLLDIAPIAYDMLFMNMTDGVLVLDTNNRIVNVNPTVKTLLKTKEDLIGRHAREVPFITREITERFRDVAEARVELNFNDGTQTRWIDVSVSPVMNRNRQLRGRLFVFRDITERKRLEDELTRYATTDTLTGVFNRRMGLAMLDKQMKLVQRMGEPLSVCFVDINKLKDVNDLLGHDEGDRLIADAAEVLRNTIRGLDSLARLGGDEFLLILPECTAAQALLVISRIEAGLKEANSRNERRYGISLAYGVAEFLPDSGESMDELVARADKAMYADKKSRA